MPRKEKSDRIHEYAGKIEIKGIEYKLPEQSEEFYQHLQTEMRHSLYGVACSLVGQANAEDALQEGFLQIYKNLGTFNCNSQITTWANRVVFNAILMYKRNNMNHLTSLSLDYKIEEGGSKAKLIEDDNNNPEKYFERNELIENVNAALEQLLPSQREALLVSLDEMNNDKSIFRPKRGTGNLLSIKYKALKKLRANKTLRKKYGSS